MKTYSRTEIATHCLAGILAANVQSLDYKTAADDAMKHADALIKALGDREIELRELCKAASKFTEEQIQLSEVYEEKDNQDRNKVLADFLRKCALVEFESPLGGVGTYKMVYGKVQTAIGVLMELTDNLEISIGENVYPLKNIIAIYPSKPPVS